LPQFPVNLYLLFRLPQFPGHSKDGLLKIGDKTQSQLYNLQYTWGSSKKYSHFTITCQGEPRA